MRSALEAAARDTTTLNADREAIARAVAAYPSVASIEIEPDFPHGMTIRVSERAAAAALVAGNRVVPTAADGTFLPGASASGLPRFSVQSLPTGRGLAPGSASAVVAVAGGVPPALRSRIKTIESDRGRGVVVPVENGPELIFGSGDRVAAKWAAATRVLADEKADGAAYIDVRIPERPAAGGLPAETVEPVATADPAPGGTPPVEPQAPATGTAEPTTQTPVTPQATPQQAPQQAPQPTPAAPIGGAGGGASPNTQP